MKAVAAKKWLIGLSSSLAVAVILFPAVSAYADSYPFFKEYGADVSAGGAFKDSTGSCSSGYQDSSSGSPASVLDGGIITYANSTGSGSNILANGGASSQYGAFADGNIDSTPGTAGTPNSGFYSDGATANSNVSGLSFANFFTNTPSNAWGGQFDGGSVQTSECIPDYYDSLTTGATAENTSFVFSSSSGCVANGVYFITPPAGSPYNVTQGNPLIVCPNANITLVVNGDAYIDQPITYSGHDVTDVPKFALVVRGNIYIDPSVTQIDGWYIAQPATGGANPTGEIWTCHDGTPVSGSNSLDYTNELSCNQQLTINGALTAKLLVLNRINGDVQTETSGSADGGATNDANAAEVINYTTDMVAGGGFFDKSSSGSSSSIESLLSLPPVF